MWTMAKSIKIGEKGSAGAFSMDLRGLNVIENGLPCPFKFLLLLQIKIYKYHAHPSGGECW